MKIRAAQLAVGRDAEANLDKILAVLESAETGEWVVFPEGMLSGYYPEDPAYLQKLDVAVIADGLGAIRRVAGARGCACLVGTAWLENNLWFNTAAVIDPDSETLFYRKVNLSTHDRAHFHAGDSLPTFTRDQGRFGVQICREVVFPEQWKALKRRGAAIVFHLNNALQPYDAKWEHLLIARAIENQHFVCSVNNAAGPQALASFIIAPNGDVAARTTPQVEQVLTVEIDLKQVKTRFLRQERTDVVRLETHDG